MICFHTVPVGLSSTGKYHVIPHEVFLQIEPKEISLSINVSGKTISELEFHLPIHYGQAESGLNFFLYHQYLLPRDAFLVARTRETLLEGRNSREREWRCWSSAPSLDTWPWSREGSASVGGDGNGYRTFDFEVSKVSKFQTFKSFNSSHRRVERIVQQTPYALHFDLSLIHI